MSISEISECAKEQPDSAGQCHQQWSDYLTENGIYDIVDKDIDIAA